MAHEFLSSEYSETRRTLRTAGYERDFTAPMRKLKSFLELTGPSSANYSELDRLRRSKFKSKAAERDAILRSVGLKKDMRVTPSTSAVKKMAALKFLRHLHLVGNRGSQKIWVLETPKSYTHFTPTEFNSVKMSLGALTTKLEDRSEAIGKKIRGRLQEATQLGLAWCEKAKITLSTAATNKASMEVVKRYFGGLKPTATDLTRAVAKLQSGFKKIANSLNGTRLIFTEMPSQRANPKLKYMFAFVRTKTEKPKTIYIEKALSVNYDMCVLHDMKKNWARVVVHEASHLDVGTDDWSYAEKGIDPGGMITPAQALDNADSWAFFAADCAGALTKRDWINTLWGTGGTLKKLKTNWK